MDQERRIMSILAALCMRNEDVIVSKWRNIYYEQTYILYAGQAGMRYGKMKCEVENA